MSEEMASKVSREERQDILSKFKELEKGTAARKEKMKKKAKLFMTGDEKAFEEELGVDSGDLDLGGGKQSESSQKPNEGKGQEGGEQTNMQATNSEMLKGEVMQGVQAQIAAQPEKGDELEEAEKRGYERALAEFKKSQAASGNA